MAREIELSPVCEASAISAVKTARAALAGKNAKDLATTSRALREFAALRDNDAERGAHALFEKYGLTLPVPISYAHLGDGKLAKFPYLKFSDWLRYLMDTERYANMCGVKTLGEMMTRLREFWDRFHAVRPSHEVFNLFREGKLVPSLCLPVFSHTDEGRAYKKLPIMVVSTHPALGRGTQAYLRVKKNHLKRKELQMGMNFVGKPLSNQFLFGTMIRECYADSDEVFDNFIAHYAQDMEKLITEGIPRGLCACGAST